jgi:phage FluMu gp28-like protein
MRYVKSIATWMCRAPDAPVQIGETDTKSALGLSNGSIIKALPGGNPDAILSHGGSVWMDEFAFHRDQKRNLANADPVIVQHGGVLRITSTPFSDGDECWTVYANLDDKYPSYSRHKTTIVDAINDGLRTRKDEPIDLEVLRQGIPDPDEFNAAYMGIPLSDSDSFWPWTTLNGMRAVQPVTEGQRYGGFDVARVKHGDFAALGETVRNGDRYGLQETVWTERGVDYPSMQDGVVRAFNDRHWIRMAIDANGIGNETAERLAQRLGKARVDCCMMTPGDKADMQTTAKHLANEGRLWIADDRDLLLDLHSIKRIITDSANIKYDSDRNERGHADRAWASMLSLRAAGQGVVPRVQGFSEGERMDWGDGDDRSGRQEW